MKKLFCLASLVALVQLALAQPENLELAFDNQKVKVSLSLVDNFKGDGVNQQIWKINQGCLRDAKQEVSRHWLLADMVTVRDGNLTIATVPHERKNQDFSIWITDGMKPMVGNFSYDSGEIESKNEYFWGYYEIRCKLPKGSEAWPAFWLYGEANGTNNEIDIFEFWNESNAFGKVVLKKLSRVQHMTTHYHGRMSGEGSDLKFDASEDFHTYGVLWTPTAIVWYTDGIPQRVLYRYKKRKDRKDGLVKEGREENVFPQSPMHILLSMGTQQTTKEAAPLLQPNFVIDYLRYYKWTPSVQK